MPHLQMAVELHYYGAQGRGQQVRWALVEGGIEFTDVVAPFPPTEEVRAKWAEIGGNLTTNVPMVVMGGKAYTQSSAAMRHVARKGGLMPADDEHQYQVDNILAAVDDYRTEGYKPIFPVMGGAPDPEKNAHLKENVIPKHFKNFERLLGDAEYFVDNKVSLADCGVFDILNNFSFNLFPSVESDYPKLVAFRDRMAARPKMAAYIASEQYTKLMPFPKLE